MNLLVPQSIPGQTGWIIVEPVHTPPIWLKRHLRDNRATQTGILRQKPITQLVLEALVDWSVTATCRRGKVTDVKVQNVAHLRSGWTTRWKLRALARLALMSRMEAIVLSSLTQKRLWARPQRRCCHSRSH